MVARVLGRPEEGEPHVHLLFAGGGLYRQCGGDPKPSPRHGDALDPVPWQAGDGLRLEKGGAGWEPDDQEVGVGQGALVEGRPVVGGGMTAHEDTRGPQDRSHGGHEDPDPGRVLLCRLGPSPPPVAELAPAQDLGRAALIRFWGNPPPGRTFPPFCNIPPTVWPRPGPKKLRT